MSSKANPERAGGAELRGARTRDLNRLTELIIGAAIEVHRHLGPGLLESAYEECLCYELSQLGLRFVRQVHLPVGYKGIKLDCGYKMDLVVEDSVILELKTVDHLLPIHSAQLLTYLKLSGKKVGLLLNFDEPILRKGLKRLVHRFEAPAETHDTSAPSAIEVAENLNTRHPNDSLISVSPRLCASAVNK